MQPLWLSTTEQLLHVRATPAHAAVVGHTFDLWRVPGSKRLAPHGADLRLTVDIAAQRMHLSLAGGVADGAAYVCTAPLNPELRGRLDAFQRQAQLLAGKAPAAQPARAATRAALLHLRALQALDAGHAGASHRDIAQALFGLEAVVLRWREDGELRAQVRHLLRRAQWYLAGGYLALAGVPSAAAKLPGGEPVR